MFSIFRKKNKKLKPVDLKNPDVVATVTNNRISKNSFGSNYRGCCSIMENYLTSSMFRSFDGNEIPYKQPTYCYVNFMSPEYYPYTLWVGRELELYEGERLVGSMQIVEIKNKQLDRNKKYKDREDVLSDKDILNVALKRSLEWGKTYEKPLDNKIMRSIPCISGSDIDKISKFVIQVRDDILWKIYYPNWDAKAEKLIVDCQKKAEEKYPWIDKSNMKILNSRGMYYSWHG